MDASTHDRPSRDQGVVRPAHPRETRQPQQSQNQDQGSGWMQKAKALASEAMEWWTKVNNDWVFNLSGLLAYNFLMSTFPILIVLLAIAGFILGNLAPHQFASLEASIGKSLPGGANAVVPHVLDQLTRSSGFLLIVGLVTSAFAGSRLFITIEGAFSIIFRLRQRDPIRQNLMAFGMLAIYAVLIPLVSLGPVIPSAIVSALGPAAKTPVASFFIQAAGIAISVAIAALLFGLIYVIVPNRPVRWREVWKGTLVGSVLLVIYNIVFPFYERLALHPGNYGSVAGFAIVILVFFYYLAFILLIGAEVNSWAMGQRQTLGDITAMLHEVQAHDTTRGIAGPTAGLPQEDLQHHKGAEAMRDDKAAVEHERVDHAKDAKPAPPGEVHEPGPPFEPMEERQHEWHQVQHELKDEHPRHEKEHETSGGPLGLGGGRKSNPPSSGGRSSPSGGGSRRASGSSEQDQQTPEPSGSRSRFAATSPEAVGAPVAVHEAAPPTESERRSRAARLAVVVTAAGALIPAATKLVRSMRGAQTNRGVTA